MIKNFTALLLAIALLPLPVFADVEKEVTVLKVDKLEGRLLVKTDRGEETLLFDGKTKGLGNAKEGAKVIIKFTEKSGEPKVIEIIPHP